MKGLGIRLKQYREEARLSQQKLAQALGTTQNNIYRFEHDLSEPNLTLLCRYADVFAISLDTLLGREKVDPTEGFEGFAKELVGSLQPGKEGYRVLSDVLLRILDDHHSPVRKKILDIVRGKDGDARSIIA